MTRKVKTISFSFVSEYDSRLLEYAEKAERGSFSKYIKRLIDNDMHGRNLNEVVMERPIEKVKEPAVILRKPNTTGGFL